MNICRYCGKRVEVTKKGLCKPHIVSKGIQCVGSAQPPKEKS